MKNIFVLVIFFIAVSVVKAQIHMPTVVVGDTINLSVSGAVGNIQWQESNDSILWLDMPLYTGSQISFLATSSITNKIYYRAKISAPLCPNTVWYSSVIRYKVCATTYDVKVGDFFRGGIVFKNGAYYWVNGVFTWYELPGSGFIACPTDYPTQATWGCQGYYLPGTNDLNNGNNNTNNINYYCGEYTAAYYASNFVSEGYNDWYLPSSNEFLALGYQRDSVGGFQDWGAYWTSTQVDNSNATWIILINSGQTQNIEKGNYSRMRFMRKFSPNDILMHVSATAIVANNPVTINVTSNPQNKVKCIGSNVTFTVAASGTIPFSYQWKKDGIDILGANQPNFDISNLNLTDDGIYTCDVTNLCRTISSNQAQLKVVSVSVTSSIDTTVCLGQPAFLSAVAQSNYSSESGVFSYQWTNASGQIIQNEATVTVNANQTSNYTVHVTDQVLSCTAITSTSVTVRKPYANQELCIVTVDPATGKNKIMYEKTFGVGTSAYILYKETSTTNVYDILVTLDASENGEFIDYFSQPEVHGDKYRMSVIDTCNNQSQLSFFHKTVNLIIGSAGSTMALLWDDYVDESGSFIPYRYYIYRGLSPSNLALFDSVPGTLNSYNDVNVFDVYYYMIGVKKPGGCNTTGVEQYVAFSNQIDNGELLTGISNSFIDGTIVISPNPMTSISTLTIPNLNVQTLNCKLLIYDVTGKIIRFENINKENNPEFYSMSSTAKISLNRNNLTSGIYFVELQADRLYRGKLIVE